MGDSGTPAATADAVSVDGESGSTFSGLAGSLGARLLFKGIEVTPERAAAFASPIEVNQRPQHLGLGAEPAAQLYEKRIHTDVDVARFIDVDEQVVSIANTNASTEPYWPTQVLLSNNSAPDYSAFMNPELVATLFAAKSRFDGVPEKDFLQARNRANPYEAVGRSIFINRAAVKMANMDYLFKLLDRRFPVGVGEETTPQDPKLYFTDVCAGPGGFTEYVLWRMGRGKSRGLGFTLKGDCDWTLHKFHPDAHWREDFNVVYGPDGTGNVYKWENIRSFAEAVTNATPDGRGVDLAMSDGGFSVAGDENYQEEHLKRLILCQFLTALCTLREGGTFVCKIFDTFTTFTVGLIYVMFREFQDIAVIKPLTSRPANSERYLIASGLRCRNPAVIKYFIDVNQALHELPDSHSGSNISEFIKADVMIKDAAFCRYMYEENVRNCEKQITALHDIFKYLQDDHLSSVDQRDVQRRCFSKWRVPSARPPNPHRTYFDRTRHSSRNSRSRSPSPNPYNDSGRSTHRRYDRYATRDERHRPSRHSPSREERSHSRYREDHFDSKRRYDDRTSRDLR